MMPTPRCKRFRVLLERYPFGFCASAHPDRSAKTDYRTPIARLQAPGSNPRLDDTK
jgi:hypothetical protein